ncbi:MAG: alpha/beta hydrolase-fold protein [Pseudomonadota bacterium]
MTEIEAIASPLGCKLAQQMPGMPSKDIAFFVGVLQADEPYFLGAESHAQDGVPCGKLNRHRQLQSRFYPGVERDYWVYVPHQYDPAAPACLMVFLDGARYLGPEVNATRVFDNLIHAGEIPVTIAVFINPGEQGPGLPIYGGTDNRSIEYDTQGDTYARFLAEELLPLALQNLVIADAPSDRAICGLSSGGICAFNVAWEQPGNFSKVVSHCGSFTNIRGGHETSGKIRREPPKPLRVFLQTGTRDLDVIFGRWEFANRDLASALADRGYDHQLMVGTGSHSLKHGGAVFPETLRWLWRDSLQQRELGT